jgi:predicted RNase H-like HicB family nuclease
MFIARYPASFLPEQGKGFHVRFPDLPEALTGGDDLADTLLQAANCLAEAIAGRIVRGDEIPPPSKAKRGQLSLAFRFIWRRNWPCTWQCVNAASRIPSLLSAWA